MGSTSDKLHSTTLIATSAVSARRFVTRRGTHANSSNEAAGVSEQACAVGRAFSAVTEYSALVESGVAFAAGDWVGVATDGSGKAVKGTSWDNVGWATADVSAGELVPVRFVERSGGLTDPANGGLAGVNVANLYATGQTHRIATWGDSRTNTVVNVANDPSVSATGAYFDATKSAVFACARMGDCEIVADYGVPGDTLVLGAAGSGWYNNARTGGKTYGNLGSRGVDLVHIQYLVNDVNGAVITNAAQRDAVATSLTTEAKRLIWALLALGSKVCFETSHPCQSLGWADDGAVPRGTLRQQCLDQINANIVAWVNANFAGKRLVAVADTAPLLKQADGFADASYYQGPANIHLAQSGTRLIASTIQAAWRSLLPRKPIAALKSPTTLTKPNLLVPFAPNNATLGYVWAGSGDKAGSAGTITGAKWDVDPTSGEAFYEFTWTPTVLSGGIARCRLTLQSPLGTASAPWTVVSGEVLAGSARVTVDDGNDGPPNAYNVAMRHYMIGNTQVYQDWNGPDADPTKVPNFTEKVDLRLHTPRFINPNTSAQITAPDGASASNGYSLILFVEAKATGLPNRIRLYSGTLAQVA